MEREKRYWEIMLFRYELESEATLLTLPEKPYVHVKNFDFITTEPNERCQTCRAKGRSRRKSGGGQVFLPANKLFFSETPQKQTFFSCSLNNKLFFHVGLINYIYKSGHIYKQIIFFWTHIQTNYFLGTYAETNYLFQKKTQHPPDVRLDRP